MLVALNSHVIFLPFFRDEEYSRIMTCINETLSMRTAIYINIYTIEFLTSTALHLDGFHDVVLEILLRIVVTFYVNIPRWVHLSKK